MSEVEAPAPKVRRRSYPCPCRICNGKERDYRTVQKHRSGQLYCSSTCNSNGGSIPTMMTAAHLHSSHVQVDDFIDHRSDCGLSSSVGESLMDPRKILQEQLEKSGPPNYSTRVLRYVLEELKTKLTYGASSIEFEDHLKNASRLIEEDMPIKWCDIQKLLKSLGYESPRCYRVCLKQDHSYLIKEKNEQCPYCQSSWDDGVDYYVLGLRVKNWFDTEEKCEKLMGHWMDKHSWLDGDTSNSNDTRLSELWHGSRFKQISWFWNPANYTLLPAKCVSCGMLISTETIEQELSLPQATPTPLSVTCDGCRNIVNFHPNYMRGDPRNQAIIIHEDGWAPHTTSSAHSMAAITVSHACSSKLDRSSGSNCQVYSFIPVNELPTKAPHKYDAFFAPLIEEVEQLFLNGKPVFFKSNVPNYSPKNDTFSLRVIPLLVTADMKARAEIGLTSAGGRKGCRRCEVVGEYVASKRHYYYGNFLTRYHHPPAERNATESLKRGKEVDILLRIALNCCSNIRPNKSPFHRLLNAKQSYYTSQHNHQQLLSKSM